MSGSIYLLWSIDGRRKEFRPIPAIGLNDQHSDNTLGGGQVVLSEPKSGTCSSAQVQESCSTLLKDCKPGTHRPGISLPTRLACRIAASSCYKELDSMYPLSLIRFEASNPAYIIPTGQHYI